MTLLNAAQCQCFVRALALYISGYSLNRENSPVPLMYKALTKHWHCAAFFTVIPLSHCHPEWGLKHRCKDIFFGW